MISLAKAFNILERIAGGIKLPSEQMPVDKSLGKILAKDINSKLDLPPFNKSAMDGYAILANDEHDAYTLIETVAAGDVPTKKLTPGTTIKVMTGAPVPEGTGMVIPIEARVQNLEPIRNNICLQGEDVKCGDKIIIAPKKITPLIIANLIACGVTEINAIRRPKIAVITTGDEIVDDIKQYQPGKIMNSNGPMLVSLCQKYDLDVVYNKTIKDKYQETVTAIKDAQDKADIIILSGGVSVGEFDFVGSVLSDLNLILHFNKVAVKPGKPMTFASGTNKLIFGLPGNPVSAYLMFYLFVLRAAEIITGLKSPLKYDKYILSHDINRKSVDRTEFRPCRINNKDEVELIKFNGSAHLLALLQCDGFAILDSNRYKQGDYLDVYKPR